MKTFLAVYTGTDEARLRSGWDALSEEKRNERIAAGMKAWGEWTAKHAAAIVENGGPLGRTKRVTKEGVADIRNNMAAYVTIRADSHEAAARLFGSHPHFTIFPGDGVEIMEVLPVPGQ
jgi:hypothetical protein